MQQRVVATPRVQEVLSVIGGLPPREARALLRDAELQFDTAELYVLRANLPSQTLEFLPGGVVTAMNTEPMPWDRATTQEVIAATFAPSPRKPWIVAGVALALTAAQLAIAWPRAAVEAPPGVPMPVVRVTPVAAKPAPLPPAPTRAEKTARKPAKKPAR